jgi:hypothetical protein
MRSDSKTQTFNTTVGDLIVFMTDVALEMSNDDKEAYFLTALALDDLLNQAKSGNTRSERRLIAFRNKPKVTLH